MRLLMLTGGMWWGVGCVGVGVSAFEREVQGRGMLPTLAVVWRVSAVSIVGVHMVADLEGVQLGSMEPLIWRAAFENTMGHT